MADGEVPKAEAVEKNPEDELNEVRGCTCTARSGGSVHGGVTLDCCLLPAPAEVGLARHSVLGTRNHVTATRESPAQYLAANLAPSTVIPPHAGAGLLQARLQA
jgi:hypothetical protein